MTESSMAESPSEPVRICVVDDQHLIRSSLVMLMGASPGVEIVGEGENGNEAVALARSTRPDVVLMDIRMPDLDGISATERIVADPTLDDVRVVMLTTFDDEELIEGALRAGASGFLLKDTEPADLLAAIEAVAGGEQMLSPAVTKRLIEAVVKRPVRQPDRPERLDALTDREREIVALAAKGLSNDEIAEIAFISSATAKTHVSRAMVKVHARDRAQLVAIAYETGLVVPGEG